MRAQLLPQPWGLGIPLKTHLIHRLLARFPHFWKIKVMYVPEDATPFLGDKVWARHPIIILYLRITNHSTWQKLLKSGGMVELTGRREEITLINRMIIF
jgi:hypothetical protein